MECEEGNDEILWPRKIIGNRFRHFIIKTIESYNCNP